MSANAAAERLKGVSWLSISRYGEAGAHRSSNRRAAMFANNTQAVQSIHFVHLLFLTYIYHRIRFCLFVSVDLCFNNLLTLVILGYLPRCFFVVCRLFLTMTFPETN